MTGFSKILILSCPGSKYYKYCWGKGIYDKYVRYIDDEVPLRNRFLRKLYVHSRYMNSGIWSVVHKMLCMLMVASFGLKKGCRNLIIVYDWSYISDDLYFISLLRKKGKVLYRLTNPLKRSGAFCKGIFNRGFKGFDAVCSFDMDDCKEYGFLYHPFVYEPHEAMLPTIEDEVYDLFFIGQAKDRLDMIHEIYLKGASSGLKCDFWIVDVSASRQLKGSDIHYNQRLSYAEALFHTMNSRCIVDIIQGESSGFTIRISEALRLDKKVLTTNENLFKDRRISFDDMMMLYSPGCDIKKFINKEVLGFRGEDKKLVDMKSFLDFLAKNL